MKKLTPKDFTLEAPVTEQIQSNLEGTYNWEEQTLKNEVKVVATHSMYIMDH